MDKEKVKEAFSIFISSIVVFFVFSPTINWVLNLLNIKPSDEFIKLFQAFLIALFNQFVLFIINKLVTKINCSFKNKNKELITEKIVKLDKSNVGRTSLTLVLSVVYIKFTKFILQKLDTKIILKVSPHIAQLELENGFIESNKLIKKIKNDVQIDFINLYEPSNNSQDVAINFIYQSFSEGNTEIQIKLAGKYPFIINQLCKVDVKDICIKNKR